MKKIGIIVRNNENQIGARLTITLNEDSFDAKMKKVGQIIRENDGLEKTIRTLLASGFKAKMVFFLNFEEIDGLLEVFVDVDQGRYLNRVYYIETPFKQWLHAPIMFLKIDPKNNLGFINKKEIVIARAEAGEIVKFMLNVGDYENSGKDTFKTKEGVLYFKEQEESRYFIDSFLL